MLQSVGLQSDMTEGLNRTELEGEPCSGASRAPSSGEGNLCSRPRKWHVC